MTGLDDTTATMATATPVTKDKPTSATQASKQPPADFHDILLDAAIKYMKAKLLLDNKQAA
jgi:hypothetical protein